MKIYGVEMKDETALIIGGVALVLGYWVLKKGAAAVESAADFVGSGINPLSQDNWINRSVNGIGAAITGENEWSLGSWLYDVINPNQSTGKNTVTLPTQGATGQEIDGIIESERDSWF